MMKRIYSIIIIMIICHTALSAQEYKYEIGGGVGMSGYLGDVNGGNVYKRPGFAGEAMFRYIMDYRWALKANLATAGISGKTSEITPLNPGGDTYKFNTQLFDLGAQIEFNFFNFGSGPSYQGMKRISPYILAGIGFTCAKVTDGTFFAMNVPIGVGVKYKLKPRLNMGLEFTMRKTFGDTLDGVDDPYGIKSSIVKNTDWYSLVMVSVSWEFGYRHRKCNNL